MFLPTGPQQSPDMRLGIWGPGKTPHAHDTPCAPAGGIGPMWEAVCCGGGGGSSRWGWASRLWGGPPGGLGAGQGAGPGQCGAASLNTSAWSRLAPLPGIRAGSRHEERRKDGAPLTLHPGQVSIFPSEPVPGAPYSSLFVLRQRHFVWENRSPFPSVELTLVEHPASRGPSRGHGESPPSLPDVAATGDPV